MMKRAKMVGVGGLGLLGGGVAVTAVALLGDSPRLFGLGVLVALFGMTVLWGLQLWIFRAQMRMLSKGALGPGDGFSEEVRMAIRTELDDVIQTVDARVLGLIELLDEIGIPPEGAGGAAVDRQAG